MVERLLAREAFLLIGDEQLADEVLTLGAHHLKLLMIKVVVCIFYLTEDVCRVLALERQVATH